MVKLYYATVSCGTASVIAAVAAGVHIEIEQVNIANHITASGVDFYTINPKGNVPALVWDDGTLLNENAAVLQYIADQAPGTVAAAYGTNERYLIQNALNYLASEVHANFGKYAFPWQVAKIGSKFAYIEKEMLKGGHYLVGDKFTIADAYLYVILGWPNHNVNMATYPAMQAYREFIGALPVVVQANELMESQATST